MSEIEKVNPNGKIMFGVDYYTLMRFMENPDVGEDYDSRKGNVVDAVISLFLLQWDFIVEEINESNKIYWEKFNSRTLDEKISTVVDRIVDFLKDDKKAQEKFLIEMLAVAQMDSTVLKDEIALPQHLRDRFDFRPSEYQKIIDKGWNWQVALNYLGDQFIDYEKKTNTNKS